MAIPKIHILMSTYNGEKYLTEQLDSIFSQTYGNFVIYIRDDGSSDSTPQILKKYISQHPDYQNRIILIANRSQKNLGYMESFWALLSQCGGADYYAFCDQDDVWLPNKLERGISCLTEESPEIPLLYFSNYLYCTESLQPLHPAPTVSLPITFREVLFYTPAFGFSMIFNEKLRQLALKTSNRKKLPHDGWIQKIAAAFGKVIYDDECTALYRRHGQAVTFANTNLILSVCSWLKNEIWGSAMKDTHFVLQRFLQEYKDMLSSDDLKCLALFASVSSSVTVWLQRLCYKKRLRPSLGGELALRICFFLGRY